MAAGPDERRIPPGPSGAEAEGREARDAEAESAFDSRLHARVSRWVAETSARFVPPLTFREVRRGVQVLSSLFVERRGEGRLAARAVDGAAKRAALASYYAPLHLLAALPPAFALARACLDAEGAGEVRSRRIHDLGCGTGAVGLAMALAFEHRSGVAPPIHALDQSGWALGEARATARAFGLAHRGRRGTLPGALPRADRGDLLVLGYVVNELDTAARDRLLEGLADRLERGAGLLLIEPLARGIAPWWNDVARALAPLGARTLESRRVIERPEWIARLDESAGLDHRELGARALICATSRARIRPD